MYLKLFLSINSVIISTNIKIPNQYEYAYSNETVLIRGTNFEITAGICNEISIDN